MFNSLQLSNIFAFLLVVCLGIQPLHAQQLPYERVTVEGQNYYRTRCNRARAYTRFPAFSVSVAEILRHNPGANTGLQSGQELLIPAPASATTQAGG